MSKLFSTVRAPSLGGLRQFTDFVRGQQLTTVQPLIQQFPLRLRKTKVKVRVMFRWAGARDGLQLGVFGNQPKHLHGAQT